MGALSGYNGRSFNGRSKFIVIIILRFQNYVNLFCDRYTEWNGPNGDAWNQQGLQSMNGVFQFLTIMATKLSKLK